MWYLKTGAHHPFWLFIFQDLYALFCETTEKRWSVSLYNPVFPFRIIEKVSHEKYQALTYNDIVTGCCHSFGNYRKQ